LRVALALLMSLLLVAGLVSPHHPDDRLGDHACAACVVGSGAVAQCETPVLDRSEVPGEPVALPPSLPPVGGAPLGAVAGQSPPRA